VSSRTAPVTIVTVTDEDPDVAIASAWLTYQEKINDPHRAQ
jgi:hypothetical protein